jgi:SAM-dependent methyltransferase
MRAMTAAQEAPFRWYQHWPKIGTDAEFAALRSLLVDANYTEPNILSKLDIASLSSYSMPPQGGRAIHDSFDALIALFYDCGFVEEARLRATLPPGSIQLFDSLSLITREHAPAGSVYSTAAIQPAYAVWTLCDRGAAPDGSRIPYPMDVVYPPVFETTRQFMAEQPQTPCEAHLDLGTGTGIAAILGARNAKHVWATDITERAVVFAEFNRRLNQVENLTTATGDLFAPVAGQTFDRITIHPPYVPSKVKQSDYVFAISGDDGEQIIRRTIEELPGYLRPGGRFHSLQVATDREGESFEQRIRKWLGDTQGEYDVMLAVHSLRTPAEYLASSEERLRVEASVWLDLWERTNTRAMVYAALLIERHAQPHPAITRRAKAGHGYDSSHLAWLLDFLKALYRPGHIEMLLSARPVGRPENELVILQRLRDGAFRDEEFRLEIPGPFALSLRCEDWLRKVIPVCNGQRTWAEIFDYAKKNEIIREDLAIEEFAKGLGVLVSLGAFKLPE